MDGDEMNHAQVIYTAIGVGGIYLAHMIESKMQDQEIPWEHINRIALYWGAGAIAYWILLNASGVKL